MNQAQQKRVGQIMYYLRRYYQLDQMSAAALEEMVLLGAGGDATMIRIVASKVKKSYKDYASSERLLQKFKGKSTCQVWPEIEDPDEEFYLKLADTEVRFVDSRQELLFFREDVLQKSGARKRKATAAAEPLRVVGIDMEEVSSAVSGQAQDLMLLQVATLKRVYLIDVPGLVGGGEREKALLGQIMCEMFNDEATVKLGFAVAQDISAMKRYFPEIKTKSVMDFHNVKQMSTKYRFMDELLYSGENEPAAAATPTQKLKGLSKLV